MPKTCINLIMYVLTYIYLHSNPYIARYNYIQADLTTYNLHVKHAYIHAYTYLHILYIPIYISPIAMPVAYA